MALVATAIATLAALALFSACEAALTSVSRIRLRHWAGKRLSGTGGEQLLERPRRLLTMASVGSNLSIVGFAVAVTELLAGSGAPLARWPLAGVLAAIAVAAPPAVLLGEVLPRTVVHEHPGRLLPVLVAGGRALSVLFWPYTTLLYAVTRVLFRALGIPLRPDERSFTATSLETLLREGEREGLVDPHEREIIGGIFAFGETPVREVMTPRTDVVSIRLGASRRELAQRIWETGFSRFPVADGSPDNVVGIVHAVDVLKAREGERLRVRPTLFVPETMTCDELLYAMRRQRIQLALVVDEYGGIAGIVTMEDLVEELVGEIRDEHDRETPAADGGEQGLLVEARARVGEVQRRLGAERHGADGPARRTAGAGTAESRGADGLDPDETLAGLLLRRLGRVPARGERFAIANLRIEVVQATPKRILRVRVRPRETPPAGDDGADA